LEGKRKEEVKGGRNTTRPALDRGPKEKMQTKKAGGVKKWRGEKVEARRAPPTRTEEVPE